MNAAKHRPRRPVEIRPVSGAKQRAAFVDLGRRFAAETPNHVPQLRREQLELVDPDKNPFFAHARVQFFIAYRGETPVGRISAHIDEVALQQPAEQGFGPGTGMFGYFDADDAEVAGALLARAETWLAKEGMTRVLGPISLSIWEEPGLLVQGQDHAPMIMMGQHPAHYAGWIETAGYGRAKTLLTYELDITKPFPPLVQRIVASGYRNERLVMRQPDMKNLEKDWRAVLGILNDAWSSNWGFVPFTEAEIQYAAKKMKPIIFPGLNRIIELDGEPVAFMLVFPDINRLLARINGRLLPFGWARLLRWLRKPKPADVRVPLMGVVKAHQNSRLASQMAFMMISDIRDVTLAEFGGKRAEIGWILEDNQGMVAIADTIGASANREYAIYERAL